MQYRRYLSSNPEICHGKVCFKGTRIPIYLVLELLGAGVSMDEILTKCYPQLNKHSIKATLQYAADLTEKRKYIPLAYS